MYPDSGRVAPIGLEEYGMGDMGVPGPELLGPAAAPDVEADRFCS